MNGPDGSRISKFLKKSFKVGTKVDSQPQNMESELISIHFGGFLSYLGHFM